MTHNDIPVLLLTGYLGCGKTTLLNNILNNRRGIRFAVIVNDIGEVNIDADLIAKGGVVDTASGDLVALQNGCICCTLKMDLVKQLMDLAETQRFDYIVIEASGICEPEPIAQTINSLPMIVAGTRYKALPRLDCIVSVVDALRLAAEFNLGDSLVREGIGEEDIENLVVSQIEFCNIVLLNKISEVTPDQAEHIRRIVKALQPRARIIECDYCRIDLDAILNTSMFDFNAVATSAAWVQGIERPVTAEQEAEAHGHHHHDEDHDEHDHEHHHHDEEHEDPDHGHEAHHHHHHHDHDHEEGEAEEYGIGTFVYYRRAPMDLNKFDWFVGKNWPASVVRTKGVIYFDQNPAMSYLFEQAGTQKKLTEAGQWYATAPADELEQMKAADPTIMRDWDPVYGDRMVKLVFIGRKMDRKAIEAALDACLAPGL